MANIEWKTEGEMEQEKNVPSELELLKQENQILALALMELGQLMLGGND